MERNYNNEIADIIMERPKSFKIDGRHFFIYPLTLGKAFLVSRLVDACGGEQLFSKLTTAEEFEKLRPIICGVIAYYTLDKRDDLLDNEKVSERTGLFINKLKVKDMQRILGLLYEDAAMEDIYKHIGLDIDRRNMARCNKVKNESDRNSFSFGGRSVAGNMIGPACEKLHMSPRQVVWDISYRFLQMLLDDSITTVYLSDDERKKVRISTDNIIVNMDCQGSYDKIRSMDWS